MSLPDWQPAVSDRLLEVELKFRVTDRNALERRIQELDPAILPIEDQEDTYLAHPSRDFAQTGEALRIRRINCENRITYKGPKQAGPTKTREEIEILFSSGEGTFGGMQAVFQALGFLPVATVKKRRTPFAIREGGLVCEVVIDEVEGIGDFSEVETLVGDVSLLAASQSAVQKLAERLGLRAEHIEGRSYLRMWLENQKSSGQSQGPLVKASSTDSRDQSPRQEDRASLSDEDLKDSQK